jgi:hypothetical protein
MMNLVVAAFSTNVNHVFEAAKMFLNIPSNTGAHDFAGETSIK